MESMHSAGVVHLDWYLSNFMWKYDEATGELVIKIIDFDSAHIIGDSLESCVRSRLAGRRLQLADREEGGGGDIRNFDKSLMNVLKKYYEDEPQLQSFDKSELDGCFLDLQIRELKVANVVDI